MYVRVKGTWPYSIARAVTVQDGFAYVGIGGGLWVFDIHSPETPRRVGMLPLLGSACDIACEGNLLLLAQKSEGMSIVDISDPASPVLLSHVVGEVVSVALGTGVALAGCPLEVKVIELGNPREPRLAASYPLSVGGCDVLLRDTLALVGDGEGGLRILGLSDPANPQLLGQVAIPAVRLAWEGNTAFVATNDTLRTVDVSAPRSPVVLGECGYPWLAEVDVLENLCARDSLVFSACALFGLRVFNVADPSRPFVSGVESLPHGGFWAAGVGVSGSYAFLAAENGGLLVADVNNPQEMSWVASFDTVPSWVENVTVMGPWAFLAARRGFWVIDISDPSTPTERGVYFFGRKVLAMALSDTMLFLGVNDSVMVLNVRNPDDPRVVGSCRIGYARAFCLKDTLLLAGITGTADAGLTVIDISHPSNPRVIGRWHDEESDPYGVSVFRSYAILGDGYHRTGEPEGGFRVIDLSDPSGPVLLSRLSPGLGSSCWSYVRNDTAFLCDEEGGLHVASVHDPENPVLLRSFTGFTPTAIAVSGGLGAIANRYAGLSMADLSEPLNVRELGYYRSGGICRNVVPNGGLYHVACDYGGYLILDYYGPSPGVSDTSRPARPSLRLSVAPSPVKDRIAVSFCMPMRCSTAVTLCDALGRNLGVLYEGTIAPGNSELELNTENLPAGTYFVVLDTGSNRLQASFVVAR